MSVKSMSYPCRESRDCRLTKITGVKAVDYSTGKSYSYGDQTGSWESITSDGGQINSQGDPNETVQSASVGGTTVTAAVTTGAISVAPITATTTKAGQLSTATGSLVRSSHTLTPPYPYFNISAQATATGTGGIVAPSGTSNSTGGGSGSGGSGSGSGANSTLATSANGSGAGPTPTASGITTQSSAMAADFRPAGAASFSLLAAIVAALAL